RALGGPGGRHRVPHRHGARLQGLERGLGRTLPRPRQRALPHHRRHHRAAHPDLGRTEMHRFSGGSIVKVMIAIGLLLLAGAVTAGDVLADDPYHDNAVLAELFEQDQSDRSGTDIDWSALSKADAARRATVETMLAAGEVRTANDYYHAAMVFQHGDTLADYRLANALATLAMELAPDN